MSAGLRIWTEARVKKLRDLRAKGFTYPAIASALGGGITEYAVAGKAARLGLSGDRQDWPESRTERLTQLWREGLSASQIAAELGGVSRNAVIGKVHRLGLTGRGMPTGVIPRQRRTKPHSPVTPKRQERPDQKSGMVCGSRVAFGSYCEGHARLCAPGLFEVKQRRAA